MSKRSPKSAPEFKPGHYDFYLVQRPPKQDGAKPTRTIASYRGRKGSDIPQRFSFTPGTQLAGLEKHECNSMDELMVISKRLAHEWMAPYEWDRALLAFVQDGAPSQSGLSPDLGATPGHVIVGVVERVSYTENLVTVAGKPVDELLDPFNKQTVRLTVEELPPGYPTGDCEEERIRGQNDAD